MSLRIYDRVGLGWVGLGLAVFGTGAGRGTFGLIVCVRHSIDSIVAV